LRARNCLPLSTNPRSRSQLSIVKIFTIDFRSISN
jgi:hypothetical protein